MSRHLLQGVLLTRVARNAVHLTSVLVLSETVLVLAIRRARVRNA